VLKELLRFLPPNAILKRSRKLTLSPTAIPLSLPASTPIAHIIQLLSARTSLPASRLRLNHGGRAIASPTTTTLASLRAASTSTSTEAAAALTLTLSSPLLRGGGGGAPKKIRCTAKACREPAQRVVGDCTFCGGHFCGRHRMLEDHRCAGLEDCKKESKERNAVKLESERTQVVHGI